MKTCCESGGIAPRINLGTKLRWVVNFTARPLYPQGKIPSYPLNRRLGGPRSQSDRGGEEKNSQLLPGLKHPIIEPVAQRYATELSEFKGLTAIWSRSVLHICSLRIFFISLAFIFIHFFLLISVLASCRWICFCVGYRFEMSYISDTRVLRICPCALTEHNAMKTCWGSGDIAPHILDLDNLFFFVRG
jgi:hypothetical protein